jgi:hypothetical protein
MLGLQLGRSGPQALPAGAVEGHPLLGVRLDRKEVVRAQHDPVVSRGRNVPDDAPGAAYVDLSRVLEADAFTAPPTPVAPQHLAPDPARSV